MLVRPEEEDEVGRFEESGGGGHGEEARRGEGIFRDEAGDEHGDNAEDSAAESCKPCESLVVFAFLARNVPEDMEDAGDEDENENGHGRKLMAVGWSFFWGKNVHHAFKKRKTCLH